MPKEGEPKKIKRSAWLEEADQRVLKYIESNEDTKWSRADLVPIIQQVMNRFGLKIPAGESDAKDILNELQWNKKIKPGPNGWKIGGSV